LDRPHTGGRRRLGGAGRAAIVYSLHSHQGEKARQTTFGCDFRLMYFIGQELTSLQQVKRKNERADLEFAASLAVVLTFSLALFT